MALEFFGGTVTGYVNGAYLAFTGVKRQADGTFTQTGAGDRVDGFTQKRTTAAGYVAIRLLTDPGVHKALHVGTTATAGALAYPAASGKISTTARGKAIGRYTKAAVAGDETSFDLLSRGEEVSAITDVKTATYTAANGETVLCDPTGGAFTVNLPPAVLGDADIIVKNASASTNAITVDADAAETIDGSATASIAAARAVRRYRPGTGVWYLIGN